jgi:hypothetical protein
LISAIELAAGFSGDGVDGTDEFGCQRDGYMTAYN